MDILVRQENLDLFDGSENLSILHISDIHLWYSTRILDKLKAIIKNNNPDLLILTGDYYDIPRGARNFRLFLVEISKKHPIVFIKGNHDTIYGTKVSNLLLDIPNCTSVENTVYTYQSKRGYTYHITAYENRDSLPNNDQGKNIILIHNPEKIKEEEILGVHLILAGHLHGGQFIFFKTNNNSNFPGSLLYKNCSDRKQIDQTTLIVSKGLGDTFPFRFNCPKEVVKIVIE